MEPRIRTLVRVEGVVQGVGFRPFVYSLATGLGLGRPGRQRRRTACSPRSRARRGGREFLRRWSATRRRWRGSSGSDHAPSPPAARPLRHRAERPARPAPGAGLGGHRDLRGLPARAGRPGRPPVRLPVHQLHQLRAAVHHRPRRALRPAADHDGGLRDVRPCAAEYHDPADRRFHAQPTCCPACGPRLRCSTPRRAADRRATPVVRGGGRAARRGQVVAVKGLGGYHLAVDAAQRDRGGGAAGPQAPGGQAVRGHGGRPGRGPRAVRGRR